MQQPGYPSFHPLVLPRYPSFHPLVLPGYPSFHPLVLDCIWQTPLVRPYYLGHHASNLQTQERCDRLLQPLLLMIIGRRDHLSMGVEMGHDFISNHNNHTQPVGVLDAACCTGHCSDITAHNCHLGLSRAELQVTMDHQSVGSWGGLCVSLAVKTFTTRVKMAPGLAWPPIYPLACPCPYWFIFTAGLP